MCVVRFASIALGKRRAVQVAEALARFYNCVGEAAHGTGGQDGKEVAKSVVCGSSSYVRALHVCFVGGSSTQCKSPRRRGGCGECGVREEVTCALRMMVETVKSSAL